MTIGQIFERLGNINGNLLIGYTIQKINTEPNKNYVVLTKGEKEIGAMIADDGSFTFYWEQTNQNAQVKVEAITK